MECVNAIAERFSVYHDVLVGLKLFRDGLLFGLLPFRLIRRRSYVY